MDIINFLNDHIEGVGFAVMAAVMVFSIRSRNKKQKFAAKVLQKAVKSQLDEPMTLHPEIDPAKCAGCGACTKVCPEGDILSLINHKAVLVSPSKCVGHGECERACPFSAIDLVFGTKKRGIDIPRVTTNYETNVPGLYIAGELGGMGLIRNAVKQGHLAAKHACKSLRSGGSIDTELLIVGAGPAGLAAGLTAIVEKKRYMVIEQNSFGGTVYNFPRQKVVMTHPADLPGVGKMKFAKNRVSKEELLAYWESVRTKAGLKINNGCSFQSLQADNGFFRVQTSKGEIKAQKVLLCLGVRGSPRRLGLPNEDSAKVAYNLIDPQQYRGVNVAVVGGGNAAAEAAQMLADAKYGNKVVLLVRSNVMDRCHEENQNKLFALEKQGRLQICYNSAVTAIEAKSITVSKDDKNLKLPNDFLFIFAGAEMPYKFLMSLGVKIDKSFGDVSMSSIQSG